MSSLVVLRTCDGNDPGLVITLLPGNNTAEVAAASGDTGIAWVEVYQVP